MHILVPVKRVIDHNVKVRVNSGGTAVETAGIKMSLNPFDEVAVEQAVRLREQGWATRVTVVTIGASIAQDVLRTSLAMGVDRAVLIETSELLEPLGVARLLRAFVECEKVDLVLCGKQDIDDDLGATGPMLAALLDWPQAVSVSKLSLEGKVARVSCDADAGTEQLCISLPAVLGVDLRLCDPRHITLPAMMRAKKSVISTLVASQIAESGPSLTRLLSVAEPAMRAPGIRLDGLPALLERLRNMPALQVVK